MIGSGNGKCCGIVWLLSLMTLTGMAQSAEVLRQRANSIYRKQPAEALRLFDQAQRLARQQSKPDLAANSRVDEATVYYSMYGDYRRATTVCRAGLQLSPLADSTRFKLWASLGEMYHQRNRPDSMTYCWQRADALLATRPLLEQEARTYVAAFWGNQGLASLEQGDHRLAERCFQKRLLLLARLKTPVRQAIAENQFGYFYLKTGDFSRADSLFQASLRHYTATDLDRAWLLLGLIDCRLKRQKLDSLGTFMQETRAITQRNGADAAEVTAYLNQAFGQFWLQKKQPETALVFFRKSLMQCNQLVGVERLAWRNLMDMSHLAAQQHRQPDALALVQQAIQVSSVRFQSQDLTLNPAANAFLNGPGLFEALCWKAHLLWAGSKAPQQVRLANRTYERAFELSDLLQTTYSSELTKLFVQEKLRPAYREAVAIAYACYRQHPEPATLATLVHRQEQGNASVLRETVRTLQQPYQGAPPYLIEQLQQAKSRLATAKTAWAEQQQATLRQQVDAELVNAELAWNRAYRRLQPHVVDGPLQTGALGRLQNRLDGQTAFLQYSLTPDSLLLTVVKQKTVRVVMLPITGTYLRQLSSTLQHEVFRNPDPFQYAGQAAARDLFNRLIKPVWPELTGIQRLVIVRDGPLHYLPFDVLETGRKPDDYLLRHVAISYAYSLNSFTEGDAVVPDKKPAALSMAPFAMTEASLATIRKAGYEPLPNSADEANPVVSTQSIAGNASKSTLLSLLPAHQLLHLATHALASDTNPGDSYIAFFPNESSYRLYTHELGLLDLRHIRLSVLSACRTGSGELYGGEGLLSLSRAFAAAGCRQVITSLWKAHDGSTATLTRFFYEELKRGQPTDVALQRAKLRFLAEQEGGGEFSPPHFWAHLVLMGQNQPVYPTSAGWPWGWLLGAGVVLVIFSGYRMYKAIASVAATGSATRLSSGQPD